VRIAFFLGAFPLVSETFILRQITGLMDLGHDVRIFAERPGVGSPVHPEVYRYNLLDRTAYLNLPGATEMELPVWPIYEKTWAPGSAVATWNGRRVLEALPAFVRCFTTTPALTLKALSESEFGYQAASLSSLYRLEMLCRKGGKFDVLHAHFGPIGSNFRLAKALFRVPLVVSFHGYDFGWWPRKNGADCYRQLWRDLDCATVNSDYTRSRVRALGCPEHKLHKLPVGLNPDDFPFRERILGHAETVRILTVARLVEKKGYEHCIRGIAELRHRAGNIHYTIIGDGPLRGSLESLIGELGLSSVVSVLGAVDSAEVRQRMSESHIFLLGSVTAGNGDEEGQGLVLQEAQACGLPVVATRHGPFPEGVLEGQSAFLVPERDARAMADRLFELIQQSQLWPDMGRRGRDFVLQHFDIRQLNVALTDLYSTVISRAHGSAG